MKRQAILLAVGFILLLITCGAHHEGVVRSIPATASDARIPSSQTEFPSHSGSDVPFEEVISWLVHELLHTLSDSDDLAITAKASHRGEALGTERSINTDGRSIDPGQQRMPPRLRASFLPVKTGARR